MLSIKLFKVVSSVGNQPFCSGVMVVPSGPKSHTFTVNFSCVCSSAKTASKTVKRSFSVEPLFSGNPGLTKFIKHLMPIEVTTIEELLSGW